MMIRILLIALVAAQISKHPQPDHWREYCVGPSWAILKLPGAPKRRVKAEKTNLPMQGLRCYVLDTEKFVVRSMAVELQGLDADPAKSVDSEIAQAARNEHRAYKLGQLWTWHGQGGELDAARVAELQGSELLADLTVAKWRKGRLMMIEMFVAAKDWDNNYQALKRILKESRIQ